jgi:hypothetical protein
MDDNSDGPAIRIDLGPRDKLKQRSSCLLDESNHSGRGAPQTQYRQITENDFVLLGHR